MFVTQTNMMAGVQNAVIAFFRTVGVDLSPQNGKNVFFNDREGTLVCAPPSRNWTLSRRPFKPSISPRLR